MISGEAASNNALTVAVLDDSQHKYDSNNRMILITGGFIVLFSYKVTGSI